MELTPELLTNVNLREQWRGYNKDDVDDFLERVAAAVAELQERLRDAERRVSDAHRRLAERADDDEIRRTLMLAQRTAATAVEEANVEAERIVSDAEARVAEQLVVAEARLAQLEVEVDQKEREQLGALAERRAAIEADIEALGAFAADHRAKLKEALEVQLRAVDASAFERPAPPATSGVTVGLGPTAGDWAVDPDVASARAELLAALSTVSGEQPIADWRADAVDAEVADDVGADDPVADDPVADDDVVESADPALFFGDAEASGAHESTKNEGSPSPVLFDDSQLDDPPEVVSAPEPSPHDDEPVEWRHAVISDEPDDDPFLAELRRAVTDTEPLGPRDESNEPAYEGEGDPHDPLGPSGRFRLRRSRR